MEVKLPFQTPYHRLSKDFEPVKPENEQDLIDRAGYRTTEQMVNELMRAGQRLEDYRRHAEFMALEDIPEDYSGDPTRRPDFDLTDVPRIYETVRREDSEKTDRLREAQAKKLAEEKARKLQEARELLAEANPPAETSMSVKKPNAVEEK